MKRSRCWTGLTGLVFLAVASPGLAGLAAVGPVNPATGFPMWFQDSNGLMLELGLDANTFFDPPIPGNALSQARGFGSEAFYFLADAIAPVAAGGALPTGGDALLVLGVEAAYLNGPPVAGEEMAFGRIRIRIDCPVAGTYRVTHPYGTQTFNVAAPGVRAINNTVDIIGQVPNWAAALATAIGPFLTAVNPAPLAGYIGNPIIGQTVTGSPTGNNFFRVEGPVGSNIGGPGVDTITMNQFTVSGKIYIPPLPPAPLVANQVRGSIDRRGVPMVDLFVSSAATATVTATVPGRTPVTLIGDGAGNFFARIVLRRGTALPASVELAASSPQHTPSTLTAPVTQIDQVRIPRAIWDAYRRRLIVIAQSSSPAATLTAVGQGGLTGGLLLRRNVLVPPADVTVQSSGGGSATAVVEIVGTPRP